MKPLVFLHGWAQSRQVWFQQFDQFQHCDPIQNCDHSLDALFLDLPGHGAACNAKIPAEQWIEHIGAQLPEPCILVGWSLGGMLALQLAAQFPDKIAGLALISSSPCFRRQHDWPAGCDEHLFAAFEQALASQSPRVLNRFFTLMLHGDDLSRSDYNALAKQAVDRARPPSHGGLQAGLELLASLDTRQSVAGLNIPVLVVHGQEDAIVSSESSDWLADTIRVSQKHSFQHCGHAPFLTQPERFNTLLKDWWTSL